VAGTDRRRTDGQTDRRTDGRTGRQICGISGFRREVSENCTLLGSYAASSGNLLPTFRDNLSSGVKWNPENGTDGSFRNVGKKLPLLAA